MTWEELCGSPKETYSESAGMQAERTFACPWGDRYSLVDALANSSGVPSQYPMRPDMCIVSIEVQPLTSNLIATGSISDPSMSLPGYLAGSGKPAAIVRASYAPNFRVKAMPSEMGSPTAKEGTWLRLRVRGSGQFITYPARGFKYEGISSSPSDPPEEIEEREKVPPDQNSRVFMPTAEFTIQQDGVSDPPIVGINALLGTVNDADFLGCAAETLLFDGYEIDDSFRVSTTAPHCWRISFNFRVRRVAVGAEVFGWNHDYRDEDPVGWKRMVFNDGNPRYNPTDLSGIFNL